MSPGYLEPPPIIPDQGDISEVVVLSQFFQLTVFTEFVTHVNSVVVQIILNSRTAILLLKKVKVYEKVCNFCCVNILPCNTAGFTFIFCSLIAPPHPPKKAKKTPVFLFFDQCFECFLFYFLGDFCQKQLRVHQWDVLESISIKKRNERGHRIFFLPPHKSGSRQLRFLYVLFCHILFA